MTRIVLVSDSTLSYEYRNFPLLDFLPCAPSSAVPPTVYKFLRGRAPPMVNDGELKFAPYALRKLESSLLRVYDRKDVVVAHEDYLEKYIDDKTEIIGVSTMDPLGVGPTTMSYFALMGGELRPWVKVDWENLLERINKLRAGKKAKLVIGGPGTWEYTVLPEEIDKFNIDYIVQGEIDDVAPMLFQQMAEDTIDPKYFYTGFMTYDDKFRKVLKKDDRFVARGVSLSSYPKLEDIPTIGAPSVKGMVEVMRGCGVGCDFCEVTLRPLRYYPVEKVVEEVKINVKAGQHSAWLHSDEIFGYKHGSMFEPNADALSELFTGVMGIKGINYSNPTHGRVSIAAGYPELLEKLSKILKAGPRRWIGIQTGVETGSDRLAMQHMPNKTLPLKIGADGSWKEIVWSGVFNQTKYYWRPAFTIQVGQEGETSEDYWDTISMINLLSNSYAEGRPFEFTITPLLNVPLGRIKSNALNTNMITTEQMAVYYAAYRHLAKMAIRDGFSDSEGGFLTRVGTGSLISGGGYLMMKWIERMAVKKGVDIEKVKRYDVGSRKEITSLSALSRA